MKKQMTLTEDKLTQIIEECVYNVLAENENLDEGFWGGMKNVLGKAGNKIADSAKNTYNKSVEFGNKVKDAYEQGSAEQDKNRAFKNCVKYYKKHANLFAQANQVLGTIKQNAKKYGFTLDDVKAAAKQ